MKKGQEQEGKKKRLICIGGGNIKIEIREGKKKKRYLVIWKKNKKKEESIDYKIGR